MKINTQIEIPDEFLIGIRTDEIRDCLTRNHFVKHQFDGYPEVWKHFQLENRFAFYADKTIPGYVESLCEVFHLIRRYTGISFLSLIQDFGWGLCRTCINGSGRYLEAGWFGECKHYPETEIMGDFGCTEYKFKGAQHE